jgi:UDP-glucose 4-epimerase
MRVLITGGAGFVGSHLTDRHLDAGDEVVIVDDFSTGRRENLRSDTNGRLMVVEARIEDHPEIGKIVGEVDLIYHLAAAVGVFHILDRPLDAIQRNLGASEVIFKLAAERQVRTIFTSTSEVYGKNTADSLGERDDSIFGSTSLSRWLYGITKAADECLAIAYHRERGLPITVVRLFNTTGPRQSGAYGMVLPRFVRQALSGQPITVFGDGSQTRCFTNVFDAVEAIVRLANCRNAQGQIVNVGQPSELSICALAKLVQDRTEHRARIEFTDYEAAYGPGFEDMRRRVPDVSFLRELIDYVPSTPIEVTIDQIIRDVDPVR